MPELPDVATYETYLKATSLHKRIEEVDVREKQVLSGISAAKLRSRLHSAEIASARRHGKLLFALLESGLALALHFGMTGNLQYYKNGAAGTEYACVILHFGNGYNLAYESRRKLGHIFLVEDVDGFIHREGLGPDALQCGYPAFEEAVFATKRAVKSALMDQHRIAGIGNVYSDEILFQAGFTPKRDTSEFDAKAKRKLFRTMKRVLETTIRHKADPDRFPRTYLTRYRHDGAECPKCGVALRTVKAAGRRAWYCPKHQH